MSSLPNPKDFNNFKIELSNRIEFDEVQQDYNLNNIYNSFKKNPIPAGYISKIFDIDILKYNPKAKEILKEYVTFSKEDDSLVIVDYKTDRIKDVSELKELYSQQLLLYKNAMEQCTPYKVSKCIIYSITLGEFVEV